MEQREYNPKVSIVIPVYNGSNYLREAIDSALNQSYKNIEIIVVNDGSNDDDRTEKIALSYGDKIRYFSKENGGSSSAINVGIKNMMGEWFSWLSHDDLYYPNKVKTQIDFIANEGIPEEDVYNHIFFAGSDFIDKNGKIIKSPTDEFNKKMYATVNSIKDNAFLIAEPTKYNFYGCSCLIHKKAFDRVGGFDENFRWANDLELWNRLYCGGLILHYVPYTLVSNRLHSAQVSRGLGFSYHNPEQDKIWKSKLEWLEENRPENYDIFFLFGRNALLKNRFVEGNQAFDDAKRICPKKSIELKIKGSCYKMYSICKEQMKKVYLKFKM